VTRAEFRTWVVEASRSMPALRQAERHRAAAAKMREHDAELAALYERWAQTQEDIERRVRELAANLSESRP